MEPSIRNANISSATELSQYYRDRYEIDLSSPLGWCDQPEVDVQQEVNLEKIGNNFED